MRGKGGGGIEERKGRIMISYVIHVNIHILDRKLQSSVRIPYSYV